MYRQLFHVHAREINTKGRWLRVDGTKIAKIARNGNLVDHKTSKKPILKYVTINLLIQCVAFE